MVLSVNRLDNRKNALIRYCYIITYDICIKFVHDTSLGTEIASFKETREECSKENLK